MADRPAPSVVAMLVGTAVISVITGYMLGIASSLGILPNPFSAQYTASQEKTSKSKTSNYDNEEESSEEEVEEGDSILDHAPNWANAREADVRQGLSMSARDAAAAAGKEEKAKTIASIKDLESNGEECKLVLVVRTDLGMTKGKIAAQCGHATLACYKSLLRDNSKSPILRRWERQGQAKIALQVKSEDEMMELMAKAMSLGITAEVIADAGRTQIASGSHTVLGVGPAPKSVVDAVTGHLKLL